MCEFRLVGTLKNKSNKITSKKFEMTTRINKDNKIYVNIGKGVELLIKFNF
jgi:hypothetical protein